MTFLGIQLERSMQLPWKLVSTKSAFPWKLASSEVSLLHGNCELKSAFSWKSDPAKSVSPWKLASVELVPYLEKFTIKRSLLFVWKLA